MPDPVSEDHAPRPSDPLAEQLAVLGARLDTARAVDLGEDDERPWLLQDLETAFEELRVAGAEIRVQQEHIDQLLDDGRTQRRRQELMLDVLPVATLTTDGHGTIQGANAAAAGLLGRSVARLVGKPLPALFDVGDRAGLRAQLSTVARSGDAPAVRARLWSPEADGAGRDLAVSVLPGPPPLTVWMLLDEQPPVPGALVVARPQLPEALTRLAGLAAMAEDHQQVLDLAANLTRGALGPGVELSVTLGPPQAPTALATTSPLAQQVDGAQIRYAEGPCVDAYASGHTVSTDDVHTDPRWRRMGEIVPDSVVAVVSVPLESAGEQIGALNVYSTTRRTAEELVSTTEILGATIGAVLHELRLKNELRSTARELERALESRAVIDQAKGIVMAERACTAEEAFDHLVRLSREQQVKVREVARGLVERRSGVG